MRTSVFPHIEQALVTLRRRPAALAVPILTMAIGIGGSTAIFSALYAALFNPLPYPDPSRLVMGRATFSGEINPWVSAPDYYDYRDRSGVFESLSAYRPQASPVTVRQGDSAESVLVTQVSWDLFRTLGVPPAIGRGFEPQEGEIGGAEVAVVSDGYWRRSLGGGRDVLGRALPLSLRGKPVSVAIVGVMPRGFRFAFDVDVWLPFQRNSQGNNVRRFHSWMLLGRLKPGVTATDAQRAVEVISAQLQKEYPDSNRNKALLVTPLQEALTEDERPNLLILMAAVAVLLLVACADLAGLLLSRGASRENEMAIRSALGATRGRLAAQLLAESLVVGLVAGGLGLILASWLRGLVLRFVPLDPLGVTTLPIDGPVLAFAVGVTVLTSLLVGTVPAWLGTRGNVVASLKAGGRSTEPVGRALFRQCLVALQVAMSVVLLVAAALLGRSLLELKAVDPGYRTANLLTARLHFSGDSYAGAAARSRFLEAFLQDVRALPGVAGANAINQLPVLEPAGNVPVWDAEHPPAQSSEAPVACARFVFPGYFKTMGIPLVAGRDLSSGDSGVLMAGSGMSVAEADAVPPPSVMVISQSLGRRLFPGKDPLGKRIAIFTGGAQPAVAEVVGVAGDVRMNSLASDYTLAMYAPYPAMTSPVMRLVVRAAGDPASLPPLLRAALARRDRGLVLTEIQTMDAVLGESLAGFSLRAGAVVIFGGATLVLAMLGVYGVLAFTVNRRRQDIGVRVVVGASRRHLLRWVLVRGLAPVLVGLVLGVAGAVGAGRWLRAELFNVPPSDPATFAAVVACLAAAAVAACLVPAWRAMHVDPIIALRAE